MELTAAALLIAATVFFFAALVHGSIGLGFPMVATPLIALLTDLQTAILLTLIPTLLVNVVSIASEGHFVTALRHNLLLALLAMAGAFVGTLILIAVRSPLFEALLALAIIGYLFSGQLKLNFSWIPRHPRASKLIFGSLAGLLGGLTNVMMPILIIYSLETRQSKSETIQTLNSCFLLGKLAQIILFSLHGELNASLLSSSSLMLFVVAAALYLGIKIRRKIDADFYKKILRSVLMLLAILLLIKAVGGWS